jgi:uroporphyrinogen-III decarboxylase
MAGRVLEMQQTPEQLYQEREKRFTDAIQLKIPDRVPIAISLGYFPAKYTGVTCEDSYYDAARWLTACKKTVSDFEPDVVFMVPPSSGKALEYLDPMQIKWPGYGVPPDHSHQAVEDEFMKADDYDAFLEDYSDFMLRIYLPRICGAMEPFHAMPPLSSVGFNYRAAAAIAQFLTTPRMKESLDKLQKAGVELSDWQAETNTFREEIEKLGFPQYSRAGATVPFDTISENFRGMQGTMLDMFRQPDKLLAACEKLLPMTLKKAISVAKNSGNPRVFIALHRGSHTFMSLKQFETFYWPTFKRLVLSLVDEELTPCVFFEGDYTSRLEYLLELPRGKVVGHFDTTDIFKAKEVLKDHMCIRGNVPSSLLQLATPQEVKDHCKELIDVVGKDGGFIMSHRSAIDEVKPENLKAMIDFTKEYGIYG